MIAGIGPAALTLRIRLGIIDASPHDDRHSGRAHPSLVG